MSERKNTPLLAILLLCVCAIPVIYLYAFAQDRYVSESQFSVVVEESSNAEASVGILAMIGGSHTGTLDTQAAIGFIHSADLLLEAEKEFNLLEHYSSPEKDYLFRLNKDSTIEERLDYYRKRIIAHYNQATGLIHLTVESFSADLSYKLSQNILEKTEKFINDLNKEIAMRRLDFAQAEVQRAHENIKEQEKALLSFQNEHKIIQPEAIIQAKLAAIQTLRLERINREIELTTLKTSSPNSPNIHTQETAIKQLDAIIAEQVEELSGADQQKLNQLLSQHKELTLNLEFATNLRKGAELILEKTRAETISTSRFFSVIQNPYLSDDYKNPKRLYLSITAICVLLLTVYVVKAIIASIYDRV
ncbi:hypothetical protein ACFPK9_06420 [Rubritalea spongiae]|uniref:Capsule biosynthesis protein n=1 Tax=Rubritalea spongiae TaxID=430797 RepID=A0ABW5E590_9BACT